MGNPVGTMEILWLRGVHSSQLHLYKMMVVLPQFYEVNLGYTAVGIAAQDLQDNF